MVMVFVLYLEEVSNQTISDNSDGTLPERVAVQIFTRGKHTPHQSKPNYGI